jgi:hypothetical protein
MAHCVTVSSLMTLRNEATYQDIYFFWQVFLKVAFLRIWITRASRAVDMEIHNRQTDISHTISYIKAQFFSK